MVNSKHLIGYRVVCGARLVDSTTLLFHILISFFAIKDRQAWGPIDGKRLSQIMEDGVYVVHKATIGMTVP